MQGRRRGKGRRKAGGSAGREAGRCSVQSFRNAEAGSRGRLEVRVSRRGRRGEER